MGRGTLGAMKRLSRSLLALTALLLLPAVAPPPLSGDAGMVSSDHELASLAGAEILRRGGNAVDAAVATALACGVVQPAGSGLGGGGFALVVAGEERSVLDFREIAPAGAGPDMYLDANGQVVPGASVDGGLAVGVPGEAAGLARLMETHGSLSFQQVAAPAVRYAKKGFGAGVHLIHALERRPEMLVLFDGVSRLPEPGEQLRRKALGRSIERWAASRGEAFYKGDIAQDIAQSVQAQGGILELGDLEDYAPVDREVLVGSYRGYTILTMPPPSSGGAVLLQVLAVLEAHDLAALGHNSSEHLHLLAEASQHAYADRAALMGDPAFVDVPLEQMLAPERIAEIQGSIWPTRTLERGAYGGDYAIPEDAGTQHIAVIDADGRAVSLTTTINTSFGSKVVAERSGVLLNNEMDDFVAQPGVPNAFGLIGREANAVAPGKKPLSSMTPTVVLNDQGEVVMAVGASGGPLIISSTLQVLSNVIDFGMDPEDAVAAPRMHHQWVPEVLNLEPGIPADVQRSLEARGHETKQWEFFSAVQLVVVEEDGTRVAAADPRKGGRPAAE